MEQDHTPDPASAVLADHCHLRIPSLPDWIGPTVDYLVARAIRCGAIHPDREAKITIALSEALTNAIIHGNLGISSELKENGDDEFARIVADRCADPARASQVVDIQASYDSHCARWAIHDQGSGFDADAALRRLDESELDIFKPSGRGLLLIRAFTDEMHYEDGGRRLLMMIRRSGEDRRRQRRWTHFGPIRVTPLDDAGRPEPGADRDVVGRNISTGGIAFLADGLAPGKRVRLTLPGEQPVEVQAEVRHWQRLGENVVEVGCRFEAPAGWKGEGDTADSHPKGLARLIERLDESRAPQHERRTSPRLPYTANIEVELSSGEVKRGFGRDLSHGGIAFLSACPLPLEVVWLRLPHGNEEPIVVRARIVRSTRLIEDFYDNGARFVAE